MDLPFVDEHSRHIPAPRDHVWEAVVATARAHLASPSDGRLTRLLRCEPAVASGDFGRPDAQRGQALPGFGVAEADRPARLVLRGRHRFSRYALSFVLEDVGGATRVRAQTHAAFPGLHGRVYRALVIGTRGHVLVVRRLLGQVEARATR